MIAPGDSPVGNGPQISMWTEIPGSDDIDVMRNDSGASRDTFLNRGCSG